MLEAAARAGVTRVVFASSIMVSWGYQLDEPYKALADGRFDDLAYCADVHGLSVICLRIGWVNAEDHPHKPESGAVWCSQRDVVQLVERSMNAPEDIKFDIFYGVSNNRYRWVDIDHAREVLGYIPEDSAENALAKS